MAAAGLEALVDGPVEVEATFAFPRPKSHFRTGKNAHLLKEIAPEFKATTPDLDKLQRAIGDALTGVVFRDDAQIASWRVTKKYDNTGYLRIGIRAL